MYFQANSELMYQKPKLEELEAKIEELREANRQLRDINEQVNEKAEVLGQVMFIYLQTVLFSSLLYLTINLNISVCV